MLWRYQLLFFTPVPSSLSSQAIYGLIARNLFIGTEVQHILQTQKLHSSVIAIQPTFQGGTYADTPIPDAILDTFIRQAQLQGLQHVAPESTQGLLIRIGSLHGRDINIYVEVINSGCGGQTLGYRLTKHLGGWDIEHQHRGTC
jgi:hypothetical protein